MNVFLRSPSAAAVAALLALAPAGLAAQQALTWDQVKARFEANNPALKADADNVDEMRAEEITADLRPNPQFGTTVDGTDRSLPTPASGNRSWALSSSPASAISMSATTSASCACSARGRARRSPNPST